MGARCRETGEVFVPPRPMCPRTYSTDMEWVELSGAGELAAYTAVYIGPNAMIAAGYDRKNPYVSGIVQLAEGPKISAQIVGVEVNNPAAIEIGAPLKVTFIERGADEKTHNILAFAAD